MDIHIVRNGARIGAITCDCVKTVAQDDGIPISITETEFRDYIAEFKSDLVIVAFDLTLEDTLTKIGVMELVHVLHAADREAPEVLLAVLEDGISMECLMKWMIAVCREYPIIPFNPERELEVIYNALHPAIYPQ